MNGLFRTAAQAVVYVAPFLTSGSEPLRSSDRVDWSDAPVGQNQLGPSARDRVDWSQAPVNKDEPPEPGRVEWPPTPSRGAELFAPPFIMGDEHLDEPSFMPPRVWGEGLTDQFNNPLQPTPNLGLQKRMGMIGFSSPHSLFEEINRTFTKDGNALDLTDQRLQDLLADENNPVGQAFKLMREAKPETYIAFKTALADGQISTQEAIAIVGLSYINEADIQSMDPQALIDAGKIIGRYDVVDLDNQIAVGLAAFCQTLFPGRYPDQDIQADPFHIPLTPGQPEHEGRLEFRPTPLSALNMS